jgi:pentatricopeptide repeat protein
VDSAGLVEVASRIHETSDTTKFPSITKMPAWALGYTLTFRVTNPSEARAAVDLVVARIFSRCSRTIVPTLLILSVHTLADHQMIDPLHKIVELFLQRHRFPFQYSLFLQALSRFPPSLDNNTMISAIIEKMHKEEGEVPEDIYISLLESNSSSVPLAQCLERLLPVPNTPTTPRLSHTFFRVYTRHGATTLATKHLQSAFKLAGLSGRDSALPSPRSTSLADDNPTGLRSDGDGDAGVVGPATDPPQPRSPSKDGPASISSNARSWTSLLGFFSSSSSISADQLVELFNRIRKTHPPTTVSYTVLMCALVSRKAYQRALETWHEMLAEGHPMDIQSLSAMIEACTLAKKHWEAFYILEVVASRGLQEGAAQPTSENPFPRIQLTPAFVATFMENLAHAGRPDVAFMLWDHAELLYGVNPDASMLNVLLGVARVVVKYEETFAGFWASLRVKRISARPDNLSSPSFHTPDRDKVIEDLRLTLDQGTRKNHKATGLWGDVPAWQKATKIFHHAVLGNNPELLCVVPPVTSIRSSANDIHRHPWAEFIRNVQGPSPVDEPFHGIDVDSPASLARLGLYPLQAYSSITPTRTTFHNQIYLLGMCGQSSQIPMILAWMKELRIIPLEKTIAMVLVFWAEVSLRAPLFEQFGGEGEYPKLLRWLEEWIGASRMPGQSRMTRVSKGIAKAREGRDKIRS